MRDLEKSVNPAIVHPRINCGMFLLQRAMIVTLASILFSDIFPGLYLWEHILEGPLEERMDGVWNYGAKTVNNLKFR